jgi:hypothetical protein
MKEQIPPITRQMILQRLLQSLMCTDVALDLANCMRPTLHARLLSMHRDWPNPEEDIGHSSPAQSEEPEPVLQKRQEKEKRCRCCIMLTVPKVLVTDLHMAHRSDCHTSTMYFLPLNNTTAFPYLPPSHHLQAV